MSLIHRCKHSRAERHVMVDGKLRDIPRTGFCLVDVKEWCEGDDPQCVRYEVAP